MEERLIPGYRLNVKPSALLAAHVSIFGSEIKVTVHRVSFNWLWWIILNCYT